MSRVKKRRNASPHKDRPTEALPTPRQLPHRSVDQWWTFSPSASLTRAAPSRASPPLIPHHVPEDLIERERPPLFPLGLVPLACTSAAARRRSPAARSPRVSTGSACSPTAA